MREFDLIPEEYRSAVRRTRVIRAIGAAYAVALVCLVAAKLTFVVQVNHLEHELEVLREAEQIAREQRAQLEGLEDERAALDQQLAALEALRGGIDARQMFLVVDRALDGDIRFKHWTFRRAGERVEEEPEVVPTGYFLVVPKQSRDAPNETWLLRTNMEIRGEATDHARLAGFTQRLVRAPEIAEARILRTGTRREAGMSLVNFSLAIVVQGQPT